MGRKRRQLKGDPPPFPEEGGLKRMHTEDLSEEPGRQVPCPNKTTQKALKQFKCSVWSKEYILERAHRNHVQAQHSGLSASQLDENDGARNVICPSVAVAGPTDSSEMDCEPILEDIEYQDIKMEEPEVDTGDGLLNDSGQEGVLAAEPTIELGEVKIFRIPGESTCQCQLDDYGENSEISARAGSPSAACTPGSKMEDVAATASETEATNCSERKSNAVTLTKQEVKTPKTETRKSQKRDADAKQSIIVSPSSKRTSSRLSKVEKKPKLAYVVGVESQQFPKTKSSQLFNAATESGHVGPGKPKDTDKDEQADQDKDALIEDLRRKLQERDKENERLRKELEELQLYKKRKGEQKLLDLRRSSRKSKSVLDSGDINKHDSIGQRKPLVRPRSKKLMKEVQETGSQQTISSQNKPFSCPLKCGKMFTLLKAAKQHQRKSCPNNPNYVGRGKASNNCTYCNKSFRRPENARLHEKNVCNNHPGYIPKQKNCQYCAKPFATVGNAKRHEVNCNGRPQLTE